MKRISPSYAEKLFGSDSIILDVSTPAEFNGSHIADSINYPLHKIHQKINNDSFLKMKHNKILLTCQSGNRAQLAFTTLEKSGFDVQVIEGGNQAWGDAGLPIVHGEGVISLERQIRIAAGSIGLVGSILCWFVSPGFIIIPTIVGAGLLNAGLTNWCGMGMLLSKMPWNNATVVNCEATAKDYT